MPTPAMRQYKEMKARYPETVLFFRMGDFYEMFYEDARIASKVLGLALTTRSSKSSDNPIPLAGLPYHAVDSYLAKMIRAGYRVAVCEQVEDPKQAKGVVKRDVVRVVTPGTLTDESLLEDKEANYLAAVCPDGRRAGVAWVDISTGKFCCREATLAGACDELARLGPAECILAERVIEYDLPLAGRLRMAAGSPVVKRPDYVFDADDAERRLKEHFAVASLEGFGVADMPLGIRAAAAVLQYLQETQKTALGHIRRLTALRSGRYLYLDEATVRSLELTRLLRGESREHTLLGVLDHARTAMGGRLLRTWLQFPLADAGRIKARLDAVELLVGDKPLRNRLAELLDEVADLERIVARVAVLRVSPRDLLALGRSLGRMPALKALLADRPAERLQTLQKRIQLLPELRALLGKAIAEEAPAHLREGGFIRDGFNEELDRLREIRTGGARWLAEFQVREAERAGIPSLRVGFNNVFGYYIEVTHAHAEKVPPEYVRKQTLKNAERYITEELKIHETEVLGAEEKALALEQELFQGVREQVARQTAAIQSLADALAELDLLGTFAAVAVRNRYTRPEVDVGLDLELIDSRHPVLDCTLGSDFVPNDCVLSGEDCLLMILTGPNMAGKSTYIRQVAQLVLMAQMGSFVPARRARIGVVDRIFTRVGASDELARGQSTFMVEMSETANILNNATARSLVILDEVGRGTSTFDGLALAWAITEHLARRTRCRTLFATHYHELTELSDLLPATGNFNVAVREWEDEVVFLHKILPGGTDKSYGIHVARLAGVPEEVVDRARDVLASLEAQHVDDSGRSLLAERVNQADQAGHAARPGSGADQLSLFEDSARVVVEELRKLKVEELTPLEALVKLKELKDKT
ncbi:MAG: DNA mismatch repair protein MutS [Anaerolineaceae bacterium]|nr:DNA mismatch repair protein MutS [Anaerolineaceae bacterium]